MSNWFQKSISRASDDFNLYVYLTEILFGFAMAQDVILSDLPAPKAGPVLAVDQAVAGPKIPAQQQLLIYEPEQWADFVQEWAHHCLKKKYKIVSQFSGANDMGVDVAGFTDKKKGLHGVWDNYQCKRYKHAIEPADGLLEIGKVLWHAFNGNFRMPRRYYFAAPKGVGITLKKLMLDPEKLRQRLIVDWTKSCENKITTTKHVELKGGFLDFVKQADFAIFEERTALQLVEDHSKTPFHAQRFGGGLPSRPKSVTPPAKITLLEGGYVKKLLDAYAQHVTQAITRVKELSKWPKLREHFTRQRIAFYHAESLRVFARDTVPPGVFESLQDDIYAGVVDVHDSIDHPDGFQRVCAVTKAARELQLTENALISRAKPQDRDGVCHQLANEDRLTWKGK